jgi:hypothetical protein
MTASKLAGGLETRQIIIIIIIIVITIKQEFHCTPRRALAATAHNRIKIKT